MLSEKPWKPEAVLFLFVGVFFGISTGVVLTNWLYPKAATIPQIGPFAIAILSTQGLALVLFFFFLRKHRVRWRDAFGFGNNWKKSVLVGGGCALLFLPVAYFLEAISSHVLSYLFNNMPAEQESVKALRSTSSRAVEVPMMFVVVFLVPFVEEIFFRGILYPLVKQAGFPRLAFFGVSLFFAAMHFNAESFIPLFVMALLLTWLYERYDNLLAPIAAHSLFNAYGFVMLYYLNQ
jgi:membrane protease YdiL (CAAX protease family)